MSSGSRRSWASLNLAGTSTSSQGCALASAMRQAMQWDWELLVAFRRQKISVAYWNRHFFPCIFGRRRWATATMYPFPVHLSRGFRFGAKTGWDPLVCVGASVVVNCFAFSIAWNCAAIIYVWPTIFSFWNRTSRFLRFCDLGPNSFPYSASCTVRSVRLLW